MSVIHTHIRALNSCCVPPQGSRCLAHRPAPVFLLLMTWCFFPRHIFVNHGMMLQDKLTPSEELGDLMRRAGDNDAALAIYQKANVPQKVIEGLAAKGDFEALSNFR